MYKRLVLRDTNTTLSVNKATAILSQCMSALCHLHLGPKVVHRDMKPENIIISENPDSICIKLADFDTARFAEPGKTLCRGVVGTFPFMAPEVIRVRKYDPFPADIWSMGMVFLEVLCRLNILKKALNVHSTKHMKRENEKLMTEHIYTFFAEPGNASRLLEKHIRPELNSLLEDSQMLHEGLLNVLVDQRWSAHEILEARDNVFTAA